MDNGASCYRRFLDGDDSGLVEIIRVYKDGLILYLNSMTHNLPLAEELCEDTFVCIAVKKPRFGGRSSFKTFLYAIGRRVAANHIRRRKDDVIISTDELSEQGTDIPSEEESPAESYIRDERKRTVHRALGRLKPEHEQILWLVYFEDLSLREAAAVMGRSVHAVESLIYRARLSMKTELEKEGITNEEL